MKIDISQHGVYQVIRIEDNLDVISDLSELRFLIQGYLSQGKPYIAIAFTNASYIYSGALAILIDCFKKIMDKKGELCLVESHTEILNIFRFLHIDQFIPVYASLDDLPGVPNTGVSESAEASS
jgi:anti-anti-sigma factor